MDLCLANSILLALTGACKTEIFTMNTKLEVQKNFHSCTVHLDTIESFIYPTVAQLDCSKNVKIYIKYKYSATRPNRFCKRRILTDY